MNLEQKITNVFTLATLKKFSNQNVNARKVNFSHMYINQSQPEGWCLYLQNQVCNRNFPESKLFNLAIKK